MARHLYFVVFERHVQGSVTEVQLPLTMVGLLACPAYHEGESRGTPLQLCLSRLSLSFIFMCAGCFSKGFVGFRFYVFIGYHVELARPTVPVQFVGAEPPPPLHVDVSKMRFSPPYNAITLDTLAVSL